MLKRYDLTEDGYRRKFRASKPEVDESQEQFIVRLDRYLLRWLKLSDTEQTFDGLKDLLRKRASETLAKIAKIADQYLEAHGKHLFSPVSRKLAEQPEEDEAENTQSNSTAIQCFKCNARGHKAVNCPTRVKRCFLCGKQGHEARNCRSNGRKFGGKSKDGNPVHRGEVSASCLVRLSEVKPTEEEFNSCIKDDQLLLACGKKTLLLRSACVEPLTGVRSKMAVMKGTVGENSVDVLRDTGCSGIVVKKDLVSEEQFTGDFNVMLFIDNTARKVPIAKIDVDTPYFKGQVQAQCLPDPIYDLVIGNVPGARAVFIQESRRSSVFTSLASACCEVLCGITAFVWNNYPCCVSDIPVFCLDCKLLTTKNIRTRNTYPSVQNPPNLSPLYPISRIPCFKWLSERRY